MDDKIKRLAQARSDLAKAKETAAILQKALEESSYGKDLAWAQERVKQLGDIVGKSEEEIKLLAVTSFDGENKQVHPVISIGEYDVLEYEEEEALKYCIEHHMPTLVNLNKSAFNKAAKTGIFEFVIIKKEPRARIASDLSEYLS